VFERGVDRHMQQGAGRREHNAGDAERCDSLLYEHTAPIQIVDPDIAAINHAEREGLVRAKQLQSLLELSGCTHEVKMKTCNRQRAGQREVLVKRPEVGSHMQPQSLRRECRVGSAVVCFDTGRQIGAEARLVELDICRTGSAQCGEHGAIRGEQPRQQGPHVEPGNNRLTQQQESDGADKHRARHDAERLGFKKFVHGFGWIRTERQPL
jgi:hypothetical protein